MAKKKPHISRKKVIASQKKLEEMMSKDPLDKEQLQLIAEFDKKMISEENERRKRGRKREKDKEERRHE